MLPTKHWQACLCRGIYEVSQTYAEEGGEPNTSPWVWTAAGQYFFWLALQAVGAHPDSLLCLDHIRSSVA